MDKDLFITGIILIWSLVGLWATLSWRKLDKTVPIAMLCYGPIVFLFKKYIKKDIPITIKCPRLSPEESERIKKEIIQKYKNNGNPK